jgi:polar amino acid transport system substrate-binding protein
MPNNYNSRRWSVLLYFIAGLLFFVGCAAPRQHAVKTIEVPPDANLLRVGITANAQPLVYRQGDNIVGLEADLARELAKDLGKTLRFVEYEWDDLIPALMANKIDIIMSGMSITRLREVRIAFAIPYFKSGLMALIRREDAARYSTGLFALTTSSAIGAIKDTTSEFFVQTNYSSVKKRLYPDTKPAVKALIDKQIDMFIYDAPLILYLASENETRGLTALFTLLTEEYLAWGVRKDNKELLESANNFLRTANSDGRLQKMIKYWIPFAQ